MTAEIVNTPHGNLRGVPIATDVILFRGIVYAAPVGPLRWGSPKPPRPESGVGARQSPGRGGSMAVSVMVERK